MLDGEPGQELQLDTGWVGRLTLPERKWRRFRAWIFTAVRSRHPFVYPTLEETAARAIEACEAAWEFFGGVLSVFFDPIDGFVNLFFDSFTGFFEGLARSLHGWLFPSSRRIAPPVLQIFHLICRRTPQKKVRAPPSIL